MNGIEKENYPWERWKEVFSSKKKLWESKHEWVEERKELNRIEKENFEWVKREEVNRWKKKYRNRRGNFANENVWMSEKKEGKNYMN